MLGYYDFSLTCFNKRKILPNLSYFLFTQVTTTEMDMLRHYYVVKENVK